MEFLEVVKLLFVIMWFVSCGILARGLELGDVVRQFEKNYAEHGAFWKKGLRFAFKEHLKRRLRVKMIFGIFSFPCAVIYKLLMKEDFDFRFTLPEDFWAKHFTEERDE